MSKKRRTTSSRFIAGGAALAVVIVVIAAVVLITTSGGDSVLAGSNCAPLAEHDRYRYHSLVTIDLADRPLGAPPEEQDRGEAGSEFVLDVDGAIENPDKTKVVLTYPNREFQTTPLPVIVVGNTEWNNVVGIWQPSEGLNTELYRPHKMCEALAADVKLQGVQGESTEIYGMRTVRYQFNSLSSGFARMVWGAGSDMGLLIDTFKVDLWLAADGGFPVIQNVEGTGHYDNGRELTIKALTEVRDIDDDSIQIVAPQ